MITVFNKYRGAGKDFIIPFNSKSFINSDSLITANKLYGNNSAIEAEILINVHNGHEFGYLTK